MDRTIVIAASAPIPYGHRAQVIERESEGGDRVVLAVTDLETRVRYEQGRGGGAGTLTWVGRVLECTIRSGRTGAETVLLIDPVGPGAAEADVALRGADAAASAVTVEALRWGGVGPAPEPEAERFW